MVDELVEAAIGNLKGGFFWAESPQGHAYWADVVINLAKMLEKKE